MLKVTPRQAKAHTVKAFFKYWLGFNSIFIILGILSFDRILTFGSFEPFKIGNVVIPKFIVGGTNLSVFLLCATGMLLVTFVIVYRYFYYKKTIAQLRESEIFDYDGDGEIDTFMDDFLDDELS